MLAGHVDRLAARLTIVSQALDEALGEARAIEEAALEDDAKHWLPGLREALERMQLECADARHAVRELRAGLPSTDVLQPRLF